MTDPKADKVTTLSTGAAQVDQKGEGRDGVVSGVSAGPDTELTAATATATNVVVETEQNRCMAAPTPLETLPPGAHRIPDVDGWGHNTPAESRPPSTAVRTSNSNAVTESEPRLLDATIEVATAAYTVEETPEPVPAKVIDTCLGVDKKRLIVFGVGSTLLLSIILAIVLGILLPKTKNQASESQNNVCGPLCGNGNVPNPDQLVMGLSCEEWDSDSRFLPLSSSSESGEDCASTYSAAAFGCGCANVEVSSSACGVLCQDGSDLPNPDMLVRDINNVVLTCADWELKAKFDSDPRECPNYNTIGMMCGCESNEPHPDACGPLCTMGDSPIPSVHSLYGTSCKNWDLMSRSLPKWYHNEADEECSEYYGDISYGCGCPGIETPPNRCNTLCQDRRVCGGLCQDGSDVPDLGFMTRHTTCLGWEYHSRMEIFDEVCPYYDMVGNDCGCNNIPPEDACGPLCGPGTSVPDPSLVVKGLTCAEWDSRSTFLSEETGAIIRGDGSVFHKFNHCDEHFSKISFACGCPESVPPPNSCGGLCADGSPLPDPLFVVGDRTCGDLELFSLFETNPSICFSYELFGYQCGCEEDTNTYDGDCTTTESLMNRTFSYTAGMAQYYLSFGSDGIFAQLESNYRKNVIGRFSGFGTGSSEDVANFQDGAPCGKFGPRRGSVKIVQDRLKERPEISYVIESAICYYEAELRVPTFCNNTNRAALF